MAPSEHQINQHVVKLVSEGWKAVYMDSSLITLESAYLDAERLLTEFIEARTPCAETLNNCGVIYIDTQRNLLGLDYFLKAVNLAPTCCEPYRNLAFALKVTNKDSEYPHLLKTLEKGACLPASQLTLEAYRGDDWL